MGTKIAWGTGQIAEGVKNSAFNTFVLFYYNQIVGVSATLTSLALMLALISDALTDPIAGSMSDRFHSKWGRRHPFMLVAAVPMAVMLFLMFNPPEGASDGFYFVWLVVCAALVRLFLTLYHVPHLALGAEMSKNYMNRTSLFSYGLLFGAVGGYGFYFLVVSVFFGSTPEYAHGMYNPDGYFNMSFLAGVIIVVSIFICVWGTRKEIPFLHVNQPGDLSDAQRKAVAAGQGSAEETSSLAEMWATLRSMGSFFPEPGALYADLKAAFSSPSYRTIFLGLLCSTIVLTIEGVFTPFMGVHFWELPTEELRWLVLGVLFGLPIGSAIAPMINRLLDKKLSVILPSIIAILNGNILIGLRLTGFFPENGDPIILPLLIGSSLIGGIVGPVIFITINSMFADIADELELITGKKQEGIVYAARAFAGKAAASIGLIVGGIALDLIAFPKQAPPGTVDPDVIFRLGLVQGPGTSIFVMAALLLYMRYKLDRNRHAEIRAELDLRQRAAESLAD